METNIPGNGPDHGQILQNIDQRICRDPRRGCEYLGQIPTDMCNDHLQQVMPDKDDEGAS
jgi:hypothetical protein